MYVCICICVYMYMYNIYIYTNNFCSRDHGGTGMVRVIVSLDKFPSTLVYLYKKT